MPRAPTGSEPDLAAALAVRSSSTRNVLLCLGGCASPQHHIAQAKEHQPAKSTRTRFEIEDPVVTRQSPRVAPVVAEATEDDVPGVAGIALLGKLLDRWGVVEAADRKNLRSPGPIGPIGPGGPGGPGGDSGGECDRPLAELQLAGGDVLSDISLLSDEATARLRGTHALPSHTTLERFLAGAGLGRVMRVAATNRDVMRRAWAMGAAPRRGA